MKTIFVIRHAEKPEGKDQGVDQKGKADEESLIVRGWQRAGALAVFFGAKEGLPAPDRIYAAAAEKHQATPDGAVGSKSKRPIETVTPLAEKLGRSIEERWSKGQEKELVAEVAALAGNTLVCWQHEAIPEIAGLLLGSQKGVPSPWPGDRFDVVWRFTSSDSGGWTFDQVCQQLLAGDSATPIK